MSECRSVAPFRVVVPDAHFPDLDIERRVTGEKFVYDVYDESDSAVIPEAVWRNCDVVLLWHRMKIDAGVVAMLDKCRLIVRVGVGFDNVDTLACAARGIPVSNVPNYGTGEVADHALAMMLHLLRGLDTYQDRLRRDFIGGFYAENVPVVRRLRGLTFGAVGMGRIGTAIARRVAAFDTKVIYFDPFLPEGHDLAVGLERVRSLQALLGRSDIVSLHTPLSATTRNMIDGTRLAQMKPDSILINIARGGLIDFDALERALRSGHLSAAGVDVIPQEPPIELHPLLSAWQRKEEWLAGRLIVTPHAAFYSQAGYTDMRTFSAEIIVDYMLAGNLRNNVNPTWATTAALS